MDGNTIMKDKKHLNLDAKKYIPFVEDQEHPNLDVHMYIPIMDD